MGQLVPSLVISRAALSTCPPDPSCFQRRGSPTRSPGPRPDQRQPVCPVRRLAGRLHLQDRQNVLC